VSNGLPNRLPFPPSLPPCLSLPCLPRHDVQDGFAEVVLLLLPALGPCLLLSAKHQALLGTHLYVYACGKREHEISQRKPVLPPSSLPSSFPTCTASASRALSSLVSSNSPTARVRNDAFATATPAGL